MSTLQPQGSGYLRWIIASEYYDGAMAGVGERSSDSAIVSFRAVAWDDEQWMRVFAIATVQPALAHRLVTELKGAETPRKPFWLPGPSSVTVETQAMWQAVNEAAMRTDHWWLVEAHDLLEQSVERIVMPPEAATLSIAVRSGSVLTLPSPSLIDSFICEIRSRTGWPSA